MRVSIERKTPPIQCKHHAEFALLVTPASAAARPKRGRIFASGYRFGRGNPFFYGVGFSLTVMFKFASASLARSTIEDASKPWCSPCDATLMLHGRPTPVAFGTSIFPRIYFLLAPTGMHMPAREW